MTISPTRRSRMFAWLCGLAAVTVAIGWLGWKLATLNDPNVAWPQTRSANDLRAGETARLANRSKGSVTESQMTPPHSPVPSQAADESQSSTRTSPAKNPSKALRSANQILSDLVKIKSRFAELERQLLSEHPELPEVLESAQVAANWRSRETSLGQALYAYLKQHQSDAKEIGGVLSLRDPEMMMRLIDDQRYGPLMRDLFESGGYAKAGAGMLRLWDQAAGVAQAAYPEIQNINDFSAVLRERLSSYSDAYSQATTRLQIPSDVLRANEFAREGYMQSNWLNKYYQSFMVGEISDLRTAYERLRAEAATSVQMQKNGSLYNEFLTVPQSLGRSL